MKYAGKLLVSLLFALCCAFTAHAQYDKDVFMFRGRNALAEGRLAEAVSHFNVLAQIDSTDYWTFFYRGIAKYNLGDIRGARTIAVRVRSRQQALKNFRVMRPKGTINAYLCKLMRT